MTLAQRELLAAAQELVTALEPVQHRGPGAVYVSIRDARFRLAAAINAVEAEDVLPTVDVPAFLRKQAE